MLYCCKLIVPVTRKTQSPTRKSLLNYFKKFCLGGITVIGLQVSSYGAVSAPLSTPAEVQPVAGLDLPATELALEKLSEQLLEDPQNPQLLLQKGIYLSESGKLQAAFDIFDSLRTRFPDQPAPYVNLASVHARWGQLEKARSLLTQSSTLQNDQLQTQLSLASVHMGLALEALTKARQINPANELVHIRLRALEKLVTEPGTIKATANAPAAAAAGPQSVDKPAATKATPTPRNTQARQNPKSKPQRNQLQLESIDLSLNPPEPGAGKATATPDNTDKSPQKEIRAMLSSWLDAWRARSYDDYASHYSAAFEPPDGSTLQAWKQRKKILIESARFIQVDINILQLQVNGPLASVRINQTYRSDRYADKTRKDLLLRLEGNQWQLISERTLD